MCPLTIKDLYDGDYMKFDVGSGQAGDSYAGNFRINKTKIPRVD